MENLSSCRLKAVNTPKAPPNPPQSPPSSDPCSHEDLREEGERRKKKFEEGEGARGERKLRGGSFYVK